jgi:quercetin dioxygenase-like cupin family protein
MFLAALALAASLCASDFQQQVDIAPHAGPQTGILVKQEFAPGESTGQHAHPGVEIGYVVKGTIRITIGGLSPAEYEVKAGGSYHINRDVSHAIGNAGGEPAEVLTTYVVDVGRPVTDPKP